MKPLYDAINAYRPKARFHMPGHNAAIDGELYSSAAFDVTELPFTDNLACPSGVIKQAERLLAEAYCADDALMFTSGATSACFVALAAARQRGDSILVERGCHKSVFSALRTFGFRASYILNQTENGRMKPLTATAVEEALTRRPCKTVILTSPTYFGQCADLAAIRTVCDSHGALLVVDSAHGAHFAFSSILPDSASIHAHLAILSLHKTLPVYTGGAVLTCKDCNLPDLRVLRAELTTSSPSYVTMASIDYARELFCEQGERLYSELKNCVDSFRNSLQNYQFSDGDDWSRICFSADGALLQGLGIEPELSDGLGSVLIATPFNGDALAPLAVALSRHAPAKPNICFSDKASAPFLSEPLTSPPFSSATELVSVECAEGRLAFAAVGLYPPGIPLVLPAERFTKNAIEILKNNNCTFGVVNGKVCVIIE